MVAHDCYIAISLELLFIKLWVIFLLCNCILPLLLLLSFLFLACVLSLLFGIILPTVLSCVSNMFAYICLIRLTFRLKMKVAGVRQFTFIVLMLLVKLNLLTFCVPCPLFGCCPQCCFLFLLDWCLPLKGSSLKWWKPYTYIATSTRSTHTTPIQQYNHGGFHHPSQYNIQCAVLPFTFRKRGSMLDFVVFEGVVRHIPTHRLFTHSSALDDYIYVYVCFISEKTVRLNLRNDWF